MSCGGTLGVPLEWRRVCWATSCVASRVSRTLSRLKREGGISLETPQGKEASSRIEGRISWFYSSWDKEIGVPFELQQGPLGTHSCCLRKASLHVNCEGPHTVLSRINVQLRHGPSAEATAPAPRHPSSMSLLDDLLVATGMLALMGPSPGADAFQGVEPALPGTSSLLHELLAARGVPASPELSLEASAVVAQQPALAGTPSLLEEILAATGIHATRGLSWGPVPMNRHTSPSQAHQDSETRSWLPRASQAHWVLFQGPLLSSQELTQASPCHPSS